MKTKVTQKLKQATMRAAALLAVIAAPSAFAASQTWSNAPTTANWNTTANWIANAAPGAVNITANNVNNDVATFNSLLSGGIGGIANPILTDDATVAGPTFPRTRQFGGITFDTANVGAYVIKAGNPTINLTDTNFVNSGVLYVSHNGTIQMTASVTNNQRIMGPTLVRLPSSTVGIYNVVNNSTNAATMYIDSLTNNSANSRGTTFVLGGSNTGTNTIAAVSRGATTTANTGTAANGLRKQGSGTWVLSGPNDFIATSMIDINDGLLVAKNSGAFSLSALVNVTSNAVLRLDNVGLDQVFVYMARNGTIRINGSGSLNGVTVSNSVSGISPTLATTSASDVFTVGTLLVVSSIVSGGAADSTLNTAGPGSVLLNTANTYIGKWNFAGKTNFINNASALGTGLNANVAAGAILDYTAQGAVSFVPTTSGFGGAGNGSTVGTTAATVIGDPGATLDLSSKNINLTFTPTGFSGDTTHPALIVAQGTLAIGGNTFFVNNASGTALGLGTYRLMTQVSGTITSGGGYAALISGSGTVGGSSVSILVSGGNVDLVVAPYVPKNLVWSGTGSSWDVATTADWLNGVTASVFNNSDNVTFNSVGSANPAVSLAGTLAPNSITVSNNTPLGYTFSGVGQIAGTTALTKAGTGALILSTANTYAGGTVVNNGTLRAGVGNAISSTGAGDVAVNGSAVIDLNGFNNTINGLNGSGSVDVQSGSTSALTVGNNDNSGSFSGVLKNTSGSLSITKIGTGSQTLSASNSYSGATTINAGTVSVANPNAFGAGVMIGNGGTVNLQTDLQLTSLTGSSGIIANNSNTSTNKIVLTGSNSMTYGGNINDGSGGGGVGLTLVSGTLTMSGNNTYTGGTLVGSGAAFYIPNGPAAVGGFVIASNNVTLGLSGGSATPGTPNSVTTVDGGKVRFESGAEGKIWQAQFHGGATATNRYVGSITFGQSLSFADFGGVVELANTNTANSNIRFLNGGGISGGENTLFVFERCYLHGRDAQTVRLGAIAGGNTTAGIGDQAAAISWEIGAKNTAQTFQGFITGPNTSIVKSGNNNLTLDGRMYFTNTVTLPDSSIVSYTLFTNAISYLGSTTVSNGTLTITAPNNLTNSPSITIAGGTLNVSAIGYATNQTTPDISAVDQPTNTVVVTTSTLDIRSGQTLAGQGNITGSVNAQAGSTVNVGQAVGTLAVSGSVSLNGAVNMNLNRTNSPNNSDRLTAASFSGSGATLNVTDAGPALYTGTICQLFSGPVAAFTTVNLPASNGATTYTWTNNIAINGTIQLLSGASPVDPNPTNITSTVVGSNLQLSWPSGHTGWTLQAQTNSLNVGISGTWFDVAGSATTNQVIVPIVPGNPTVFYRLKL